MNANTQFSETAPMTVQPSTLNAIADALKQRALSDPSRSAEQVLDDTLEVVGRRVETLDKFQHEIKQDLDRIRVKITFKDKHAKLIPPEFDYRPKWDEKGQQLWHQQEAVIAGKENLAVIGRHREGKVDTGEPVFESNYPFRMGMLVRGLAANSFHLANIFVQVKDKPVGGGKPGRHSKTERFHVLNLEFRRGDEPKAFEPKTVAGRRALMKMTFNFCKVWSNPDKSMTVNVGGLAPERGQVPRYALVVRHGHLATKMLDSASVADEATE